VFAALFLHAASPGQVLRFFERRNAAPPIDLLLSDRVAPLGFRALTGVGDTAAVTDTLRGLLEEHGPAMARVFVTDADAPSVTLVFAAAGLRWGWRTWRAASDHVAGACTGADEEVTDGTSVAFPLGTRLFRLLTGAYHPSRALEAEDATARAIRWAREQGLPIDRVPGVTRQRIPVIDYATVAGLDQRGLLVEDSPRLYRFTF